MLLLPGLSADKLPVCLFQSISRMTHSYFRPNVDAMTGYVPGEQPKPGTSILKLNTNENPYPPSPEAIAVLHDFDGERLRLPPAPTPTSFVSHQRGVRGAARLDYGGQRQ